MLNAIRPSPISGQDDEEDRAAHGVPGVQAAHPGAAEAGEALRAGRRQEEEGADDPVQGCIVLRLTPVMITGREIFAFIIGVIFGALLRHIWVILAVNQASPQAQIPVQAQVQVPAQQPQVAGQNGTNELRRRGVSVNVWDVE